MTLRLNYVITKTDGDLTLVEGLKANVDMVGWEDWLSGMVKQDPEVIFFYTEDTTDIWDDRMQLTGDPVTMYFVIPENFGDLIRQTGVEERTWHQIYKNDEAFNTVTKAIVVKVEPKERPQVDVPELLDVIGSAIHDTVLRHEVPQAVLAALLEAGFTIHKE